MLQNTKHLAKVNLKYGTLQSVVDWCERNCTGEWHYTEDPNGEMYFSWLFVFEDEKDFVAFSLFKQ